MNADLPRVSVIVVNWNRADLTQQAIDSLTAQVSRFPLTIVVVDNGSDDGSADALAAANPSLDIVRRPTNGGFAAGVNAGIASTSSEFVVLMNNDAVAEPDFVENIVGMLHSSSDDVAAATGRILLTGTWSAIDEQEAAPATSDAAPLLTARNGAQWRPSNDGVVLTNSTGNTLDRSGNGGDRSWLAPHPAPASDDVFGFSGGAVALRRASLEAVGVFDESLFMYYEDTELSWRLRRSGHRIVFAGDAVVHHRHAGSSGTQSTLFIRANARNRIAVAIMHGTARMAISGAGRTLYRVARTGLDRRVSSTERAAVRTALADVAGSLPRLVRLRRQFDRSATVSRHDIVERYIGRD